MFGTTKLWNNNHRPERVKPAFEASRERHDSTMSIAISSIPPLPSNRATSRTRGTSAARLSMILG